VRPVLGRNELHRVDAHHAVELVVEREILQVEMAGRRGGMLRERPLQRGRGVIDADHPPPAVEDHPEVLPGATCGVEDHTTGPHEREEARDPLGVRGLDLAPAEVVLGGELVLFSFVDPAKGEQPVAPLGHLLVLVRLRES
jgi:hypothetical protein